MIWKKKSQDEIKNTVFKALSLNVNYAEQNILGVPASYLDEKVFYQDAHFLKEAPFISTLVQNPNHIGCHTLGASEHFFAGTQAIEKELLEICAVDILKGDVGQQDGYVASGGTEANMQAIWIYRNYFMQKYGAKTHEIAILCSADSHYSMDKAGNILMLDCIKIPVMDSNRSIERAALIDTIRNAKAAGKKYFITICTMMTTMFGSVDDVEMFAEVLESETCTYRIHIDGAYGGFYFPFTEQESAMTFQNPNLTSFTLDAHKMAQAPYGTGIFLIRKGFIQYANTEQASYVEGEDFTLIGSRSGANAVAVWMILVKNGPFGWQEKVFILQKRTEWMCKQLTALNIEFYRNPNSNIITMRSAHIPEEVATEFGLVPDNHKRPKWYKIVIMEHVTIEKLEPLVSSLKDKRTLETSILA